MTGAGGYFRGFREGGDVAHIWSANGNFPKMGARVTSDKDCLRAQPAVYFRARFRQADEETVWAMVLSDMEKTFADGPELLEYLRFLDDPPYSAAAGDEVAEIFVNVRNLPWARRCG